jgi:2-polyprenyl-3-methyl-5-hydroxy-6-metoxy-1,4-benzoquinol methylase
MNTMASLPDLDRNTRSTGQAEKARSKIHKVRRFFAGADNYLKDNYNIQVRSHIVGELLGNVCHSRILDLGCGDGSISLPLLSASNHLTLVDLSENMLRAAVKNMPPEHRARVDYVARNLLDFEPTEAFDIVLCIGVLAHVDSLEETVAKVSRLLRPGGQCILEINDSDQFVGLINYLYCSVRRLLTRSSPGYALNRTTLRGLVSLAAARGLRLESVRRHALLLPGMGRLPKKWLLEYDLFMQKNRCLSEYGSEALALFVKRA